MPGHLRRPCLRLRDAALAALVLVLVACGHHDDWTLADVTGVLPPLEVGLHDTHGRMITAADLRGKVVLLYFGYTHCPDVCPTTLATLAGALRELGAEADRVRVLFVTVDPARDTPEVLAHYTKAFGPQFVGLYGDDSRLRALTRRFRVSYGLGKPDSKGRYEVSHSSAVFVFDEHGEARLLARSTDNYQTIAHDLRTLIDGT